MLWELVKITMRSSGKVYLMVVAEGEAYRGAMKTVVSRESFHIEVVVRDENRGFLERVADMREEEEVLRIDRD